MASMSSMARWVGLAALSSLAVACGSKPGAAAKAVQADRPTASDALGQAACVGPGEDAEPWVFDLEGTERSSLFGALAKGVVVVTYDCKKIKVLSGCTVAGNYAYQGTGTNEDVMRLEDADSAKATLSGAPAFAAKLDAEMKRGTKLSIGYVVVGESNTTVPSIARGQVSSPQCQGATHFIASASLGAFQMQASTNAEVSSAAQIFGQGASAGSSSSSGLDRNGGKRPACDKTPDSPTSPITDCNQPLKIRLVAIREGGGPPPPSFRSGGVIAPAPCPTGYIRSGYVCVSEKSASAASYVRTCKPGDAAACEDSCKKGDAISCALAGLIYEKAKGAQANPKKAMEMYDAACAKRNYDGCAGMGYLYSKGLGVTMDPHKAEQLFRDACSHGNGRACSGLGHQARLTGDFSGATPWFERACGFGYARACFYAGVMMAKKGDFKKAYSDYDMACTGDDDRGCLAESALQAAGKGTSSDTAGALAKRDKALKDFEDKCNGREADACETLGDYYLGQYDPSIKNGPKALGYYGRACGSGVWASCTELAHLYERGEPPIPPNKTLAMTYYKMACTNTGEAEACKKSGGSPGAQAGLDAPPPPDSAPPPNGKRRRH